MFGGDWASILTALAAQKIWGALVLVIALYYWDRERQRRASQRALEFQAQANDAERRLDEMRDKRMDRMETRLEALEARL